MNPLGFPGLPCHHGVAKQPDVGRPSIPRSPPFDTEGPEQSGPFVFSEVVSPLAHGLSPAALWAHAARGRLAPWTSCMVSRESRQGPFCPIIEMCTRRYDPVHGLGEQPIFQAKAAIAQIETRKINELVTVRHGFARVSVVVLPRDPDPGVAVPPKDSRGLEKRSLLSGDASVAVLPNEWPRFPTTEESGPWIRWRIGLRGGRVKRRRSASARGSFGSFPWKRRNALRRISS